MLALRPTAQVAPRPAQGGSGQATATAEARPVGVARYEEGFARRRGVPLVEEAGWGGGHAETSISLIPASLRELCHVYIGLLSCENGGIDFPELVMLVVVCITLPDARAEETLNVAKSSQAAHAARKLH